mmetsp:Transcript_8814/g.23339  ORF Transcript_8814/g.23339 Transcript_8814/m.23339 type:complete len:148 (+) Transcript_8814:377-820(+)
MKSLLRSPRLLLDLCELMRPLYAAKPGGAGSKAQQKAAAARKRLANLNRAGRNRPVAMPEAAAQPDAPTPHAAAEAPAEAAADDNGGAGATPEEAEELRARLAAAGECLADSRRQRALEASRLGLEVERAMLACIGTKRRRTCRCST